MAVLVCIQVEEFRVKIFDSEQKICRREPIMRQKKNKNKKQQQQLGDLDKIQAFFSYGWGVIHHMCVWINSLQLCLTLCHPMDRLLCPWNFPGKNTGMGCYAFLQRIFPTQELSQVPLSPVLAGGLFTTRTTWEDPHLLYPFICWWTFGLFPCSWLL